MNKLYYGDNLDVLRRHVADESVDLVYLDPPFKSNQDYNVLFAEHSGERAAAQITAFEDTWRWDEVAAASFQEVIQAGGRPAEAMSAFMVFLGGSDMMAYLSMMAPRLVELRRVLKPTGSIYLHCDPTASHYLKLLMDAIFGAANFQNEIIWGYRGGGVSKSRFGRKHDTLFFYSNGKTHFFEPQFTPYSESTRAVTGRTGRRVNKTPIDLERGGHMPDWWTDFNSLQTWSPERLGYPTQKPLALLERIIEASSRVGEVILDPFCGCGTAVDAAQRLNRRWIGIDVTHLAVNLIRHRLRDAYGPDVEQTYEVIGEPTSIADAEQLAEDDPYQFQWWALGLVGARPIEKKKGRDKGIDGTLFFLVQGEPNRIIISVKAGTTGPAHVRDLRGVIERDDAALGVLITMKKPTPEMRSEAASAGFFKPSSLEAKTYPRIQLLTVADLLGGKDISYPISEGATFKRAAKATGKDETAELPF